MNRPTTLLAAIAAATVLALTGCGGGTPEAAGPAPAASTAAPSVTPSPTPTVVTAVEYETLEDLHDAIDTTTYPCDDFGQTDRVTLALESGQCTEDDVLCLFLDTDDLKEQLDNYRYFNKMADEEGEDRTPTLVGPNWTINSSLESDLLDLQDAIGGKILR